MKITPELIEQHQLTSAEYDKIVTLLGREPSYTELGVFSVMWSEHCSYKSSRIHLKKLPQEGKYVVQGPGENAGAHRNWRYVWVIAFKIESHNHPSYIEPFQGAATGVGGILRIDIFTMGARPIAVIGFSALWSDDGNAGVRAQSPYRRWCCEWHRARFCTEIVSAMVPTVGGECICEECYSANPLVNVFALGVCKEDEIFYAKASGIGNPVIYVGAKNGPRWHPRRFHGQRRVHGRIETEAA